MIVYLPRVYSIEEGLLWPDHPCHAPHHPTGEGLTLLMRARGCYCIRGMMRTSLSCRMLCFHFIYYFGTFLLYYARAWTRPVVQVQWEKLAIFTFSRSALDMKNKETEANLLLEPLIRSSWDEIGGVERIRQRDL